MDKMKGLAKGGWHPAGDKKISRDTWKSDLKGIATGKKQDPYAYAHEHQSAPLSTLKDPASFAPPPKHRDYYPNGAAPAAIQSPSTPSSTTSSRALQGPSGGWGSAVPAPTPRAEAIEEANKPKAPPVPYRTDTSGLRTDNLPKPPVRRADGVSSPVSNAPRPAATSRSTPAVPARQAAKPPPILPPRQNEYPDEYTPAPPPSYDEARKAANTANGLLNQNSINRLGQAGVSVPGLGVGGQSPTTQTPVLSHGPQLGELQQRFARMNTGGNTASSSTASSSTAHAAAAKKPPPPPPPKKSGLGEVASSHGAGTGPVPPPVPMSSKPRPE